MNPDISITKASLEKDASDIIEIISSSADWYRPFLEPEDMAEHEVDYTWAKKNFKIRDFYVAKNAQGDTVGVVTLQDFKSHAYVGYCYVHTQHVGKGIGKKLLSHAEGVACEDGYDGLVLLAHPEAHWAVRAYKKYGFSAIATQEKEILRWNNCILTDYYEAGFHLYEYPLNVGINSLQKIS